MVAAIPFITAGANAGLGALGQSSKITAQNRQIKEQTRASKARSRQEQLRGKREGNTIRLARIQANAAAAAQGAAGGIDVAAGPTQGILREISTDANRQLEIVKSNTKIGVLGERILQRNLARQRRNPLQPILSTIFGPLSPLPLALTAKSELKPDSGSKVRARPDLGLFS